MPPNACLAFITFKNHFDDSQSPNRAEDLFFKVWHGLPCTKQGNLRFAVTPQRVFDFLGAAWTPLGGATKNICCAGNPQRELKAIFYVAAWAPFGGGPKHANRRHSPQRVENVILKVWHGRHQQEAQKMFDLRAIPTKELKTY